MKFLAQLCSVQQLTISTADGMTNSYNTIINGHAV